MGAFAWDKNETPSFGTAAFVALANDGERDCLYANKAYYERLAANGEAWRKRCEAESAVRDPLWEKRYDRLIYNGIECVYRDWETEIDERLFNAMMNWEVNYVY